jgi:hypothetical protein
MQHIGDLEVEADFLTNRHRERDESARDEDRSRTACAERAHQFPGATHELDPFGPALLDHALGQPLEQRHAARQRLGKVEFAAHGAFGHLGDLRLESRIVGQLVDALDGNHGRIHIGHEQAAVPIGGFQHEEVSRRRYGFDRGARRRAVSGKGQVGGFARLDPGHCADIEPGRCQRIARRAHVPLPKSVMRD